MEVLKASLSNRTSINQNKNSKNQNLIQNLKHGLKNNELKNKQAFNNIKNKSKGIPLINNINYKQNIQNKKTSEPNSNKDLLSNNLLIRASSYKKIENSDNKNVVKASINKKTKKNIFEYKTQKLIENINKDMTSSNLNLKNNLSNYQYRNIITNNNETKNMKGTNLSNIITEDIIYNYNKDRGKDNKIVNHSNRDNPAISNNRNDKYLNINFNKTNLNNNNIHNIISILTSKNKIIKRNTIQTLKNIGAFNKNAYNSNYNNNCITKNNYIGLMTSSNSNINSNLKSNIFKKKLKINSINNLNISNNVNSIISPTSSTYNTNSNNININNENNTLTNYSYRINHLNKPNKMININYNINKNDNFKNCKSQMFKRLNSNIINEVESLNSSNNYFINTNNSNNKYLEKKKIKINKKYIYENGIKNTILDNKPNCEFLKRNKTERGNQNPRQISSNDKTNKNFFSHHNLNDINKIYSNKELNEINSSYNKKKNKKIFFDGINHINNGNKINFNNNLNNKNKVKNSKILLLNNSSIFSPIIRLKNKGNHKHNASIGGIGGYSSKFNNLNINKSNKSNNNININNIQSSEKRLKNKFNVDNSNNSFSKKLNNKLNYLNINLNNLSNINNTIGGINTFPTHINTVSDGAFNIKKKLKNKFFKKNNDSYYNKSLINSNNNIIILNNISMNNLNNISFDYLLRLTKKKNYKNSYKSMASIKKQVYNYVSKEKNNLDNHKELEKQREYYNNQKRLHNKKNNYKNNNRIKEQNLNGFNLKQINNIILKKNKNNDSINLKINTLNTNKYKNDILITQRNNTNYNNSINFSHNKKIKNKSNEFHHRHNFSNNLNIIINTNNTKNNPNKNITINNSTNNNISYNNQKSISNIIQNLKGKIDNNVKEKGKEKISKITSARISPKKISDKKKLKPQSKDEKGINKNNNINSNIKNVLRHSIKIKETKKNSNKKDIILRNNDEHFKEKNIVTEYDNNLNCIKKKINMNYLSDINEISIEGNKKIKENISKINEKENENNKENVKEIKTYKCHTIDNKMKNNEIKIIKNKGLKLKYLINKNLDINENDLKEKEEKKEKEKEELNKTTNNILLINKDEDPQQGKEYVPDIIESLLIEENYYLNKKHYIDPYYLENENSELTPEMRTVAVDWLVLIHHKIFKFQENTLFLTIQIFDRYLSKVDLNTEKTELLLLTSFMLASKHNEIDYVNMQETLQLAQNKFTKEQVIEMESDILGQINFEILSPTMCEYFKLFASFLNLSETKINHGFYVLNIVLVDFHMLEYPNFMLALAVVKLITKRNNRKLIKMIKNILERNKFDKFLEYLVEENYEEIFDICSKIKLLYNTFLETKYKNIQEKFAESKYNCVSSFTSI